jgi:tetratricopeptide (TPR) repeat protein
MINTNKQIQIGQHTYPAFQIAFICLIALQSILILFTFRDYGITSDETHHIKYGEQIVRWYTSGFKDQALFQTENTWLYGGFFDTTAYLISQLLPLDRYDANHFSNAIFGLLGVIAAYRIGTALGGPFTGFLAALALFLTPRYYGHAFNNPKDIPFAVCYLWSVYYIIQCYKASPNIPYRYIIGLGLSIGFALGIRIGGLLLIVYLSIAFAIQLYQHRHTFVSTLKTLLPKFGLILLIAYLTMLICWPYALQNPISGPIIALKKFSQFVQPHTSFFAGRYVLNTELPRDYAPTWLLITLPEFALFGILAGLYVLLIKKRFDHLLLLFTGAFPILYAVIMNTPLYDGLRHLLFAIPPLTVFGVVGISNIIQNPKSQYMGATITLLLFMGTTIEMIRLHPNQYIYFNTLIAGGPKNASARYETDYWENTFKQGIRWAEKNLPIPPNKKIQIGGFSENIRYMLDNTRSVLTPYPEESDVYLGTARYDRHRKVPGEILHIITSANTPLLYLIRPDTSYQHDPFFTDSPFYQFRLGEILEAENKPNDALTAYQKSLEKGLQQATAEPFFLMRIYIRIGNQYETLKQYNKALNTYFQALEYAPNNGALHNNIGIVFARLNDHDEAIRWLQKSIQLNPRYFTGFVNLASAAYHNGNFDIAREAYRGALNLKEDSDIRHSLGKLEAEQGNFQAAITEFRRILKTHPNHAQTLHDLAIALVETKDLESAKDAILRAIKHAPDDYKNHFTLGSIAMYQSEYMEALGAYQKALERNPKNPDVHVGLGLAFVHLGDIANAQKSLQNALILDPQHTEAKQHLQTISR